MSEDKTMELVEKKLKEIKGHKGEIDKLQKELVKLVDNIQPDKDGKKGETHSLFGNDPLLK